MKTTSSKCVWGLIVFLLTVLFACSPSPKAPVDRESMGQEEGQLKAAATASASTGAMATTAARSPATTLPVRFQKPAYTLADSENDVDALGVEEEFVVEVGANFSTSGAVMLRDIMKKLASHKKMNISWSSDVDQYSYVDVDIRAHDDFFKAIDNLLRQRDYFHEVQGNTVVIKYKETKKFHIAMPFLASTYTASVGATVTDNSSMGITSESNTFDIWDNIEKNLDLVLNIWEEASANAAPPPAPETTDNGETAADDAEAAEPARVSRPQSAKGYYTIDKPIGLITVTAPRRVIIKVEDYLNNLKTELYKQISIEAKILEVTISGEENVGIDWESLLNVSSYTGLIEVGTSSLSQPFGPSASRSFTMNDKSFGLLISAFQKQGRTKVLANPKISVMNGQPALINVGKNVTYIDKVTTTVDEGVVSTDVTTAKTSSGIVMSVVPTILDNNEIIINLTPVTSQLEEPIEYRDFGDSTVGLPVVNIRELSTIVRIKQGDMLVVGGLISSVEDGDDSDVIGLGKIPIIGGFFSHKSKVKIRKELVILLKPEIIS